MDKGQLTGTLFIDLSKAFDTVSHGILLNKLPSYGICDHEKEFFSGRGLSLDLCYSLYTYMMPNNN